MGDTRRQDRHLPLLTAVAVLVIAATGFVLLELRVPGPQLTGGTTTTVVRTVTVTPHPRTTSSAAGPG